MNSKKKQQQQQQQQLDINNNSNNKLSLLVEAAEKLVDSERVVDKDESTGQTKGKKSLKVYYSK